MAAETVSLKDVYDGWEGYETSLAHAVAPLTPEQLRWRPAAQLRAAGELASHISVGRLDWFRRMRAPGSEELAARVVAERPAGIPADDAAELVRWLEATWQMIATTLSTWTVADLSRSYPHTYQGRTYAISRQWTIWRILAHDLHHGGELAVMLGMQGIAVPELGDLGGHLSVPPLAEP